jgi:uronate dehydrogenase
MTERSRILITGPGGRIGPQILPLLRKEYQLRLLDINPLTALEDDQVITGDVRDERVIGEACLGVDALVHLAAISDEDEFYSRLLPHNLEGVYTAFESARKAGLKKVIFASTGQTVVNYPAGEPVTVDMPARPCTVYACTKLFGEALARHYSDNHGMSMICIRICWFQPYDSELLRQPGHRVQRDWCSPGDLAQLMSRCLRSDVRFGVYFGMSDNRERCWEIENARKEVGYIPKDNAADYL